MTLYHRQFPLPSKDQWVEPGLPLSVPTMWLALICQKLGRVPARPIASFLLFPQGKSSSVIVSTYKQASPP